MIADRAPLTEVAARVRAVASEAVSQLEEGDYRTRDATAKMLVPTVVGLSESLASVAPVVSKANQRIGDRFVDVTNTVRAAGLAGSRRATSFVSKLVATIPPPKPMALSAPG